MAMELQPPPDAYYERTSIDLLVSKLNEHATTPNSLCKLHLANAVCL